MGKKDITKPTMARNVPTGSKFLLNKGNKGHRTMLTIRGMEETRHAYVDDNLSIMIIRGDRYVYPVVPQVLVKMGDCSESMLRDSLIKIRETKYNLVADYVMGVEDCCLLKEVGMTNSYRVVSYKTEVELVHG